MGIRGHMRRTKILATFGPAIDSDNAIRRLISAGVNLFRVNCSHGETDDFLAAAKRIRTADNGSRFPVALLFDISGPKLRLARFTGTIEVRRGDELTLVTGKSNLPLRQIGVNHAAIIKSLKKDQRVFIDDGVVMFDVVSAGKDGVVIRAANDGDLTGGKGINLPDTDIGIPTITPKDRRDIKTAVDAGADYLALSFVRKPDDIKTAQRLIKRHGGKQQIIAKLEKCEAIEQLEEIIELADGVMVARGDLGVELPAEELPRLQKKIIRIANNYHKPVIVATQMLESMRFNPRPTRAEVNDVASAVFDYVDAVMLSAETATGKYPVRAVEMMARVIETTEADAPRPDFSIGQHQLPSSIPLAIADAVGRGEVNVDVKLILAFTTSGFTARMLSNLFPRQPIVALTPDERVMRALTLHRSVYPVTIKQPASFDDMINTVRDTCYNYKLAKKGDTVVITGGAPFGSNVPTNFMMYHQLGKK